MPGRLIWSDECDAAARAPPDPRYWKHETGAHGWGNGELQAYTSATSNAFHDGKGHLVLRARRDEGRFTSARLVSKGLVTATYGRIECRARLARGAGLWSAFWALGADIDDHAWPACGEIDIMENLGREPYRLFGTVHCPGHAGRDGISGDVTSAASLHEGFHDYAVDWQPDRITWLLDDTPYFSVARAALGTAWVFDHPFYLLMNLAVGGWLGGDVAPDTSFPAELVFEHIRIYAR